MTTSDYIALASIFIILGIWGYRIYFGSCPDCYNGTHLNNDYSQDAEGADVYVNCSSCNGTGRKSKRWL